MQPQPGAKLWAHATGCCKTDLGCPARYRARPAKLRQREASAVIRPREPSSVKSRYPDYAHPVQVRDTRHIRSGRKQPRFYNEIAQILDVSRFRNPFSRLYL